MEQLGRNNNHNNTLTLLISIRHTPNSNRQLIQDTPSLLTKILMHRVNTPIHNLTTGKKCMVSMILTTTLPQEHNNINSN
jgi:hypothetical protein